MADELDEVFDKAAELFAVVSTPIQWLISSQLCQREKSIRKLLECIEVPQPNMSQHLNIMYRSGVLGKRRQGAQVFYRIADQTAVVVCRAVCTQVAISATVN